MSDKTIPRWHDLSFGSLNQFSKELKANPDFILLAEYAELKEKGLRKQYHKKLDEFIVLASNFAETKRRNLVQLICQKKAQWKSYFNSFYLFDSYPLTNQFIVPTLQQWIVDESQNPEPLKWLGLFYYRNDINGDNYFTALERSLALNPTDEIVQKELIRRYLDYLNYSIHHLNDNFYIGDPSEGLKLCWRVGGYLKNVQDKNTRVAFSQELEEYRNLIYDWQKYKSASIKVSFFEWCHSKKSPITHDLNQI